MADPDQGNPLGPEQPLLQHLLELRTRFLRALIGVIVILLPLAVFSRQLYGIFARPLVQLLPAGTSMIATKVVSPFLTPLKLSAFAALFLAMPWVLYQIWGFVAPGLYKNERRLMVPLLVSSTLLFYAGIAFAYFVTLPIVFRFTLAAAPEGVVVATDIGDYLDFMMTMFIAFGAAFETPVAVVLLVITGFVTTAQLKEARGYVLVGVFVVAAIITPPDVFSQLLVAIPSYLLYEVGIFWAGFIERGRRKVATAA